MFLQAPIELGQAEAGIDAHGAIVEVERELAGQPVEADNDLAAGLVRRRSRDEARIARLGDEGDAAADAVTDGGRDLFRRYRTQDGRRAAAVVACAGLVSLHVLPTRDDALVAKELRQCVDMVLVNHRRRITPLPWRR